MSKYTTTSTTAIAPITPIRRVRSREKQSHRESILSHRITIVTKRSRPNNRSCPKSSPPLCCNGSGSNINQQVASKQRNWKAKKTTASNRPLQISLSPFGLKEGLMKIEGRIYLKKGLDLRISAFACPSKFSYPIHLMRNAQKKKTALSKSHR